MATTFRPSASSSSTGGEGDDEVSTRGGEAASGETNDGETTSSTTDVPITTPASEVTTADVSTSSTTDVSATETSIGEVSTSEVTTTVASSTGEDVPAVCEPVPGEGECTTCVREQCCDEVVECLAQPACACVEACLEAAGFELEQLLPCAIGCGIILVPPGGAALLDCHEAECGGCLP